MWACVSFVRAVNNLVFMIMCEFLGRVYKQSATCFLAHISAYFGRCFSVDSTDAVLPNDVLPFSFYLVMAGLEKSYVAGHIRLGFQFAFKFNVY